MAFFESEVFQLSKTEVLKHFLSENKDKSIFKCKHRSAKPKFLYHLEYKHKNLSTKIISKKSKTIQPSTVAYFNKIGNKAEVVLARLTAVDHIPFATLANNEDIKNGWKAQGLKIPDD